MYAIHFGPPPQPEMELPERSPTIIRRLTLDERAVSLSSIRNSLLSNKGESLRWLSQVDTCILSEVGLIITLLLAVNIDFDYFSRHSGTGM